ncbi:MAG TPA: hypothetical protein VM369_04785 [Candidatus Binatia bacterium]|nr:hypothetical protein [Candidatus Binatia bacterium]
MKGALLALLLMAGDATAAEPPRCADIHDGAARLACYDRQAAPPASAPDRTAPVANRTPAPAPAARPAAPDSGFGLPPPAPPKEATTVRSRIVGPFDGWTPRREFELANHQVWRCEMSNTAYFPHVPDDAEVVIERGFLGSYWMQVLAPDSDTIKLKVRRVR